VACPYFGCQTLVDTLGAHVDNEKQPDIVSIECVAWNLGAIEKRISSSTIG
jgi:hypothetical protein